MTLFIEQLGPGFHHPCIFMYAVHEEINSCWKSVFSSKISNFICQFTLLMSATCMIKTDLYYLPVWKHRELYCPPQVAVGATLLLTRHVPSLLSLLPFSGRQHKMTPVVDVSLNPLMVVGWCEGAVYLTSLGRPTDIGLQLGKACYPCSG